MALAFLSRFSAKEVASLFSACWTRVAGRGACVLALWLLTGPVDDFLTLYFADLPKKSVLRLWDSCLHGAIAAVSWLLCLLLCPSVRVFGAGQRLGDMAFAFAVAFLVDVDHVFPSVVAYLRREEGERSLAAQEWRRGIFHQSAVATLACCGVLARDWLTRPCLPLLPTAALTRVSPPLPSRLALASLLAVLSHHVRDAVHHGLWLWPLPPSPPWGVMYYRGATLGLPLLAAVVGGAL